jgi:N-acetyl-alpha-D-muramate 1-phosphate uridylyltransferase
MTKITQSFIFAAGRGERMKPLTDSTPKPLLKVKDKAIIDYTIEKLDKISDIKKIIINGFYLADQIEDHIKKLGNNKIIFSREISKVETGGGLLFANNLVNFDEPILTFNGDVLWQENSIISDIELLCKNWNPQEHDILLGLKTVNEYLGYEGNIHGGGDFNLKNGRLFRFSDSPMSHVFVGLQIINPKILYRAKEDGVGECFSMNYFYKSAVGEGGLLHRISGLELKGKYFHIGTPNALKMTEENL